MMENLVDYENLIVDIVSWLPVESVLQCYCVCKSWRALLHETYFTQIHTDRSLQQQQQLLLLLLDDYDADDSTPVSFFNLVYFPETDSHEFHVQDYYVNYKYISSRRHRKVSRPLKHPPPSLTKEDEERRIDIKGYCSLKQISWEIVGSCNGLICLYGVKTHYDANYNYNTAPLIIYNPLTREYLKLPPVDQSQSTIINKNFKYDAYGFGYHPSTKEYKVVRVINQQSAAAATAGSKSSYARWVQIYTLGGAGASGCSSRSSSSSTRGKWKVKKKEEEADGLYSSAGVPSNGALYWKIVGNMEERKIICFDLADETFQIIRSPPPPPFFYPSYVINPHYGNVSFDYELGVLGQHLCATLRTHLTTDIWVMKRNIEDNIVECSWSKKFSIPANLGMGWKLDQTLKQPIKVTRKGRVLFIRDHEDLFTFDPITESIESLGRMHLFKCPSRKISYTKSFVSLKALGEEGATIL